MLKVESCLVPGSLPALECLFGGQRVGPAQLGRHFMYRADVKPVSEVLTDSRGLLIPKSTGALFTTNNM